MTPSHLPPGFRAIDKVKDWLSSHYATGGEAKASGAFALTKTVGSLTKRIGRTSIRLLEPVVPRLIGAVRVCAEELLGHTRLDIPIALILLVYVVGFVPIIPRATENPQLLTCCINDEAPLSMALDGMRAIPFGDPMNFLLSGVNGHILPAYWGSLNYTGAFLGYYGGLYPGIAFLAYAPLLAFGLDPFPTAPILLRIISTFSGLLALLITYNFGRRHSGRVAASIGALILMTDIYFSHYSLIIHPDALQLALGMLGLTVAARHLENGDIESALGLGLIVGLVQGAKAGGPWLIPIVIIAATVGLLRQHLWRMSWSSLLAFGKRGLAIGGIALLAFFVTTPYAFLRPEFLSAYLLIIKSVTSSTLTPISYVNWLTDLWTHFGPVVLGAALAGTALVCLQMFHGSMRWPMLLLIVLGLSQIAWFSSNGKLWVELGYMLCAFAAIGLLVGEAVATVYRLVRSFALVGRPLAMLVVAAALILVVGGRWWGTAALALEYRLIDSRTIVQVGRWAEAGRIPRDARILWDDTAYFDPTKFSHARMRGDLLTYDDLYQWRPDYIILSSSIYDARHYAEMRKTQHYSMQNEGPHSVRLYQDLLDTTQPGPTRVPGIEYVRSFSESLERNQDCSASGGSHGPYQPWLGANAPGKASNLTVTVLGNNPVGLWFAERISGQVYLLNHAGRLIDAVRGRICISTGPTLRLYHVNKPGTRDGFSQPISSAGRPHMEPLAAFDGQPSFWMPTALDAAEDKAWIGFDFGGGSAKRVDKVRIEWANAVYLPGKVEVQFADYGQDWKSAGSYAAKAITSGNLIFTDIELPPSAGSHRLWRVAFHDAPASRQIAVREVRFIDRGS